MPGPVSKPAIDAVLTMWPSPPCASRRGMKVRIPWMTPQRFTPSTHSHSSTDRSHASPPTPTPALLQITWTAPKVSTVRRASASTWSARATSVTTATTVPPRPRSVVSTSSRASRCTSASATFMPSSTNRSASARPMPLPAPVTTATRLRSSCMAATVRDAPARVQTRRVRLLAPRALPPPLSDNLSININPGGHSSNTLIESERNHAASRCSPRRFRAPTRGALRSAHDRAQASPARVAALLRRCPRTADREDAALALSRQHHGCDGARHAYVARRRDRRSGRYGGARGDSTWQDLAARREARRRRRRLRGAARDDVRRVRGAGAGPADVPASHEHPDLVARRAGLLPRRRAGADALADPRPEARLHLSAERTLPAAGPPRAHHPRRRARDQPRLPPVVRRIRRGPGPRPRADGVLAAQQPAPDREPRLPEHLRDDGALHEQPPQPIPRQLRERPLPPRVPLRSVLAVGERSGRLDEIRPRRHRQGDRAQEAREATLHGRFPRRPERASRRQGRSATPHREMSRRRVIVIGIDGAEPSIFFDLLDHGRLPFFARMAVARGTTRSVQPIISPAAWATVMTGCRPGRHRLFGFQREDASGEIRVATGRDLGAGSLWRYLGERGRRCIAVNVPMTYPPEDVPGVIVSGVDTPSLQSGFLHPATLRSDFLRAVPDYEIDLRNFGGPSDAENRRKLLENAKRVADARARAFQWLLGTQDWDLGLVVFTEMDRLQHDLWVDHDPGHPLHDGGDPRLGQGLAEAYAELDRLADRIVTPWLAEEPLVIVMSDHGAGTQTRKFSPAPVLREAGLLRLSGGASYRRVVEGTVRLLRKQPRWLKDFARSAAPAGMQRRGYSALLSGGIDFTSTIAYPAEFPAAIRLRHDLTGTARSEAIAAVRECLAKVHDPVQNGPAIRRIWERDEIWPGPYRAEAPDLFFEMADPDVYVTMGFVNLASGEALRAIESSDQSGGHRPDGIFLASGPGVRPQRDVGIALEEFFPALGAYACGRYPDNLDGALRRDVFDVEAVAEPWQVIDGRSSDDLGDDDEAQVRARLEGLGYL